MIKHPKLAAGEMAQWVKALTAKPDDLRSMLRTHRVEDHRLYFYLHTCIMAHEKTHTYNNVLISKLKPDVVAHSCDPIMFRVETGESEVQEHPSSVQQV